MYSEPWSNIEDFSPAHGVALLTEMATELPVGHELYGKSSKILAKREDRDDVLDKTIVLALNNLHEISEKIEKELVEIKKDIEYSKTLYFSYLRSKPYFEKLKKLECHSSILDSRLDLFLRLVD